jgi:hypothetical protein
MWHACDIGWCQFLSLFVDGGPFRNFFVYQHLLQSDGRCCEVADLFGSDGAMRNVVVQLGIPICRTAGPWWTWWSPDLAVEFHIPWFQALVWLYVDSIQKHIKGLHNEIFQSWNNECIECKVEHSNSIQKHILRVCIINPYLPENRIAHFWAILSPHILCSGIQWTRQGVDWVLCHRKHFHKITHFLVDSMKPSQCICDCGAKNYLLKGTWPHLCYIQTT